MRSPDGGIFDVSEPAADDVARAAAARAAEELRRAQEEEAKLAAEREAEARRRGEEEAARLAAERKRKSYAGRRSRQQRTEPQQPGRSSSPPHSRRPGRSADTRPIATRAVAGQIRHPMAGVGQGTLWLAPNGTFNGQLTGFFGAISVQGGWQVLAPNQFALQGQQSNGFQVGPYYALTQVAQLSHQQLAGMTQAGEQIVWTRLA